jgi:hypothetical protein
MRGHMRQRCGRCVVTFLAKWTQQLPLTVPLSVSDRAF